MALLSTLKEKISSSIGTRIMAMGLAAAVVPVLLLVVVIMVEKSGLSKQIGLELDKTLQSNLSSTAAGVRRVCETQDAVLRETLRGDMNVAKSTAGRSGGIHLLSDSAIWSAKNQFDNEVAKVALPKVAVGGTWFGQNTSKNAAEPVVDEVARQVGCACTVFQRMNEHGDMLRVATSVVKKDGSRAIGTYIPAVGPDGKQNAVVSAVLGGSTYVGRAFVVDDWYLSTYEPIRDSAGKVIGMLFVGLRQDGLSSVRKAVLATAVGKSGYTFVLQGSGEGKGTYVISKNGERDGECIWDAKDADGKPFIQTLINRSVAAGDGKYIISKYPWQNKGESRPREKMAAVTYYEPWDWVIGVSAYQDEFQGAQARAAGSISRLVGVTIVVGLVACLVVGMATVRIGTGISKPLQGAVSVLRDIAEGEGDLTKRLAVKSQDEVGQMCGWFNSFMDNLHSIISRVSASASEVTTSSQHLSNVTDSIRQSTQMVAEKIGDVASGSIEQSKTVQLSSAAIDQLAQAISEVAKGAQEQATTVEGTVGLTQEISSSIASLTDLSREAASSGREVSQVATSGGAQVSRAVEGMVKIKDATDRVAEMVKRLGDSSQQIGAIVEIIDDIAEQTNLLALNAAIEAARAGEHGKGFAVVADEVRKLAERSSSSTAMIADLVHGIQEITETAVQAMDSGSREVAQGSELATEAGKALTEIQAAIARIVSQIDAMLSAAERIDAASAEVTNTIANVSAVTEETTAAAQEMNASSTEVADQMNRVAAVIEGNASAAEEVSGATQQQSAAVSQLADSAEQLYAMADELQSLVSRFKLGDEAGESEAESDSPRRFLRAA